MGPPSNDWSLYMRKERDTQVQRHTWEERPPDNEGRDWMMQLQAKECRQRPEAAGRREDSSPDLTEGARPF